MFSLVKTLVRGCRHLAAQFVATQNCPICFDGLPVIGKREASEETQETHVKLSCRHKFCADCILPYVEMKVKAREVNDDQLVCPVVECKRTLTESDIAHIGGGELLLAYTSNKKRLRDEKNPHARWCPVATCGELIICNPNETTFTCPTCATKGCFSCRGVAHRFWFCRANTEDASYHSWEKSVGSDRALRSCPRCQMRIWKNDGCNHMTCTSCSHHFCWVCGADWQNSHYRCIETRFVSFGFAAITRIPQFLFQVSIYFLIAVFVAIISVFGFFGFLFFFFLFVSFCRATRIQRLENY